MALEFVLPALQVFAYLIDASSSIPQGQRKGILWDKY